MLYQREEFAGGQLMDAVRGTLVTVKKAAGSERLRHCQGLTTAPLLQLRAHI